MDIIKRVYILTLAMLIYSCDNLSSKDHPLQAYYVSPSGNNSNEGRSIEYPLRTIKKATQIATAGDTIYIREGVYREGNIIDTINSGKRGNYITYQNYPNEKVIIKGSVVVREWEHYQGNIWKLPPEENDTSGLNRKIHYQQVFYENQKQLQKIGTPNYKKKALWDKTHYVKIKENSNNPFGMSEGTFYVKKLKTGEFDLYIWLPDGKSPNDEEVTMEVSDKKILVDTSKLSYIIFKGITFMHTAAEAFAEGRHLQGGYGLKIGAHSIVDNCQISYTDFVGLSLSSNNKKGVDQHQIVRNSKFHHNGALGIVATSGGYVIQNNEFYENATRPFKQTWHTGAIKSATNAWGEIKENFIHDERSHGIWFDYCHDKNQTHNILIHHNKLNHIGYLKKNPLQNISPRGHGIFIEVSSNVEIYNNIIANTMQRGIYLSTSTNTHIYHNIIAKSKLAQLAIKLKKRANYIFENNLIEDNLFYNKSRREDVRNHRNYDLKLISDLKAFGKNNIFRNNTIFNENNKYKYSFRDVGWSMDDNFEGNLSNINLFEKEFNINLESL